MNDAIKLLEHRLERLTKLDLVKYKEDAEHTAMELKSRREHIKNLETEKSEIENAIAILKMSAGIVDLDLPTQDV